MSFNKKINYLNSCDAFLKLQIINCGSKLSCPQNKMIQKLNFKIFFLSKNSHHNFKAILTNERCGMVYFQNLRFSKFSVALYFL